MVLEHLFPEDWLEKKIIFAFVIAVVYSLLGIAAARLLFGANSGIVSVVFTSLFILPYLQKMFKKEEKEEEREEQLSLTRFASIKRFFRVNQAIRVYAAIFLGIYLTYMLCSFILPQLGFDTLNILKEQMLVEPSLRGRAADAGLFFSILANNWWVLLACFILAIVVGDGALFFVAWNASSWGSLFGYRALAASQYSGESALWYLVLVFAITLPHVILEAGAYILAAISGNIISDEIIQKKREIRRFIYYFLGGLLLVVFIRFFYKYIIGWYSPVVFSIISLAVVTFLLPRMVVLFRQQRLRKVFKNNYYLFLLAIFIFLIGALVETLVLNHSFQLNLIYAFSRVA